MGVYPTGWSGRIAFGRDPDPAVIQLGSVIEADFKNGVPTVDVSYVKGYTVPMYVLLKLLANSRVISSKSSVL